MLSMRFRRGRAQLVINSPAGSDAEHDDSIIRKAAGRAKVPYVTTTSEAYMAALGIAEYLRGSETVRSLQEWHATMLLGFLMLELISLFAGV